MVSGLTVGANKYRWTKTNGKCPVTADVTVTVNKPTQAYAGEDFSSCFDYATLSGNTPEVDEEGTWEPFDGYGKIADENIHKYNTVVTNLGSGNNSFIWKIRRGSGEDACYSYDTVVVNSRQIKITVTTEQPEVCTPEGHVKGYVNVDDYTSQWVALNGISKFTDETANETDVTLLQDGNNVLRWSVKVEDAKTKLSCDAYADIVIVNNTAPKPLVNDTLPVCGLETDIFGSVPPQNTWGEWGCPIGKAEFEDQTAYQTRVRNLAEDINYLTWTIHKGRCTAVDTMVVVATVISTQTSGDNGSDSLFICGTQTSISAAPAGKNAEGWWESTDRNIKFVNDLTNDANTAITNVSTGAHTLIWTVKDKGTGCMASAKLVVVNNQYSASANLASQNPICDGYATVIGNVPAGGATGHWRYSETGEMSDENNPVSTYYPTAIGLNTVYWVVEKGKCKTEAKVDMLNYTVSAEVTDEVTVCSEKDSKSLIAQEPPSGGFGYWELVNGDFEFEPKSSNITTVSKVQQGANTIRWHVYSAKVVLSDAEGDTVRCHAYDDAIINNNQFTTYAGIDDESCGPEFDVEAIYQGPKAVGFWSGPVTFSDPSNYKTHISGLRNASTTTLRWTVRMNNCEAYDEVNIYNAKVDIVIPSGSKPVCSSETNLEARHVAGEGTWTTIEGGGRFIPGDEKKKSTMIYDLNRGPNTIRYKVINGQKNCETYEDVVINNASIDITAGYDRPTCDTFYQLAGTPLTKNQIGHWSVGVGTTDMEYSGDGPTFVDKTLYNTRVNGLYHNDNGAPYINAFTWTVKDTSTQCDANATVYISCYKFTVDADTSTIMNYRQVAESSVTIGASASPYYTGLWRPVIGAGSPSPDNEPVTTISGLGSGQNVFQYVATLKTDPEGTIPACKAYGKVQIDYMAFTVEAGDNRSICSDSVQLHAQAIENAHHHWTSTYNGAGGISDPDKPDTWVHGLRPGKNVFWWNVTKNGSSAVDSVIIYSYQYKLDAGKDQHLCEDTTTLRASAPLGNPLITDADWSGWWDTEFGSVHYYNQRNNVTYIDSIRATRNTLVWHMVVEVDNLLTNDASKLRCESQDTVYVTYYTAPKPDFTVIPRTKADCSPLKAQFVNNTVNTDTTGSVFYRWNFGDLISFDTQDHDSIYYHEFTNNSNHDSTLTISLTTGINIPGNQTCYASDSTDITVFRVPTAKFYALPAIQRQKETGMNVSFYADSVPGQNRYTFTFGDGNGAVWNDNSQYVSPLVTTYTTYGEFDVKLIVNNEHNCKADTTIHVSIIPAEPATTSPALKLEGCEPSIIELYDGSKYTDSLRWEIYNVTDSVTLIANKKVKSGSNSSHLFTQTGKYLMVQYGYGPGTDDPDGRRLRTDTVIIYPTPVADFTIWPDTVRLPNIPLYTSNESVGALTYLWDFGDGTTDQAFEPTHYYEISGDFYVNLQVTSEHGCSATSGEKHVRVEPEGMLRFPNAFVPDPSGPCGGVVTNKFKNYVFLPYPRNGIKEGTYMLEIFNRYGEKIFESNDPEIGWDGYYRGELCKQDVYVFKAKCTFENGKLFKQIGNVTLIR
jgi:gliding motility-associated-like protein